MNLKLPNVHVRSISCLLFIFFGVLQPYLVYVWFNVLFGFGLLIAYRIPLTSLWEKVKPLILFFLFSFLFFLLLEGKDGAFKALLYIGRLVFVAQMLTFIFYQNSLSTFLQTLTLLKVPSLFIDMISFTLRFLDVFRQEFKGMLYSLRTRGFTSGSWFRISKYVILSKLLGSMLQRAFLRGERVYLGMLSKGYSGAALTQKVSLKSLEFQSIIPIWAFFILLNACYFVGRYV